eukprot:1046070-Rhodomonas_salina.3
MAAHLVGHGPILRGREQYCWVTSARDLVQFTLGSLSTIRSAPSIGAVSRNTRAIYSCKGVLRGTDLLMQRLSAYQFSDVLKLVGVREVVVLCGTTQSVPRKSVALYSRAKGFDMRYNDGSTTKERSTIHRARGFVCGTTSFVPRESAHYAPPTTQY